MTQAIGGANTLKPVLRLERTETTERIEVQCPAGSSLSVRDNFISCVPQGQSSPVRPPNIDAPMSLGSVVDGALKLAEDARRGGYHNNVRSILAATVGQTRDLGDLTRLVDYAARNGYNDQARLGLDAATKAAISPREALDVATQANRFGFHNQARAALMRGLEVSQRSGEASEVANWAKTKGYNDQARAGFARSSELLLQGR